MSIFKFNYINSDPKLKQFISSLREKSNYFKIKRNELTEIRTEVNITQNTLDILKNKDKEITEVLIALEEQKGISGYFSMQEKCLNKVNEFDNKLQTKGIGGNPQTSVQSDQSRRNKSGEVIKDLRPLKAVSGLAVRVPAKGTD